MEEEEEDFLDFSVMIIIVVVVIVAVGLIGSRHLSVLRRIRSRGVGRVGRMETNVVGTTSTSTNGKDLLLLFETSPFTKARRLLRR